MLTFRFWLRVKRKRLGYFLQTSRAAPRRGGGLNWRGSPNRRGEEVHRFLKRLGERDTSGDTATLSQRGPRRFFEWTTRRYPPQRRRRQRKREGRRTRKYRRELGEIRLDRKGRGDWGRLHRTWGCEGSVLRGRDRRRPLERYTIVLTIVVVPPFADIRCSVPSNKDDGMFDKLLLVQLEVDDKAETIPLQILGTTIGVGKPANRVTNSPRSREGRWKLGE